MGIEKKWEVRARGLGPGTADLEPEGVLTLILWLTLSQTPPPPPLRPPRPPPPRGPLPPAVPTRLPVSGCHVHELSGQPLHLPPPAPLLPSDEVLLQGCVSPCGALSCGPGPYLPDALPSFSPRHPFRCGNKKCLQSPSEVPWGTVSPGGEWQNWAPRLPVSAQTLAPEWPSQAPCPGQHPSRPGTLCPLTLISRFWAPRPWRPRHPACLFSVSCAGAGLPAGDSDSVQPPSVRVSGPSAELAAEGAAQVSAASASATEQGRACGARCTSICSWPLPASSARGGLLLSRLPGGDTAIRRAL